MSTLTSFPQPSAPVENPCGQPCGECEHDLFKIGHTSTSVSLACGVVKARDLKGEKNNVIALIGDGSLSGGEALEGLNNASTFNSNFIIIVNDNEMSIAENHGGLYDNLRELRETNGTAQRNFFKTVVKIKSSVAYRFEIFRKLHRHYRTAISKRFA